MAPNRIIIDTDPGVDDVLAMLLALASTPDELEILLLSVQFGNVDVQNCLRNVVSLFHHIGKERAWRKEHGRPEGFQTLNVTKPIVAVGAEEPLAEHMMVADFFHGVDGLGGIHESHPHLTPAETWKSLFKPAPESMTPEEAIELQKVKDEHSLFIPSLKPAHEEMLRLLRENERDTITIVAVGPLTNLAIAAATDTETFLRVKEVVIMGGAVDVPGNSPSLSQLYSKEVMSIPVPQFRLIKQPDTPLRRALNIRNQMTPGAEFNTYADSVAAARVFALTSPNPHTTMPVVSGGKGALPNYPAKLSRQLKIKLFPLDITSPHLLPKPLFTQYTAPLAASGSPLANWTTLFVNSTYRKIHSIRPDLDSDTIGLEMHDPLTIWYALTANDPLWRFKEDEDIRIETSGQWTRGTCIVDRRGKGIKQEGDAGVDLDAEVTGDAGGWLDGRKGNRVGRCIGTPGETVFAEVLLERLFGDVA
ncbi:Inosine/uridine-preferring nucleoside hydrolase domain-containing protein [Dendryphion nanum]|uniref:Inosine/uridine-preferring nucleoside hydrolase domain-containing protein n=1 Tax=Dendryphion nanum TaxID=256645 RepID=A0A9P9IAY5_9PLEO|nr:Inosine/uridine-preferring nucleoside hydrolase domain-containing protein [Dendryphion nanum]